MSDRDSTDKIRSSLLRLVLSTAITKLLGIIVIVLAVLKLNSLNKPKEVFCSYTKIIDDCQCKGITKKINGEDRCYNPELCKNIANFRCESGLHLVQLENFTCPSCKKNPCTNKQLVVGCECKKENRVKLSTNKFYCNIGPKKCDEKINEEFCRKKNRDFDYKLKKNSNNLTNCPTCVMKSCKNLQMVNDCDCSHTLLHNDDDSKSYCIDKNICSEIALDEGNKCPKSKRLVFKNTNNQNIDCPKCESDTIEKQPDIKETNISNTESCSEDQNVAIRNVRTQCPNNMIMKSKCVYICGEDHTNSENLKVILTAIIVPIIILIIGGIVITIIIKKGKENQNNSNHIFDTETNKVINETFPHDNHE
ncbi:MAG: hypothetical protein MHPSP_003931 [Paramarteilia canceri]